MGSQDSMESFDRGLAFDPDYMSHTSAARQQQPLSPRAYLDPLSGVERRGRGEREPSSLSPSSDQSPMSSPTNRGRRKGAAERLKLLRTINKHSTVGFTPDKNTMAEMAAGGSGSVEERALSIQQQQQQQARRVPRQSPITTPLGMEEDNTHNAHNTDMHLSSNGNSTGSDLNSIIEKSVRFEDTPGREIIPIDKEKGNALEERGSGKKSRNIHNLRLHIPSGELNNGVQRIELDEDEDSLPPNFRPKVSTVPAANVPSMTTMTNNSASQSQPIVGLVPLDSQSLERGDDASGSSQSLSFMPGSPIRYVYGHAARCMNGRISCPKQGWETPNFLFML